MRAASYPSSRLLQNFGSWVISGYVIVCQYILIGFLNVLRASPFGVSKVGLAMLPCEVSCLGHVFDCGDDDNDDSDVDDEEDDDGDKSGDSVSDGNKPDADADYCDDSIPSPRNKTKPVMMVVWCLAFKMKGTCKKTMICN